MKYFVLLLVLMPLCAFGEWSSTAGIVRNIYSHNGYVLIDTGITDGPCVNKGGFWWPISDDDSQIMLSLVIAGQSSGKLIKVVYNSTNPECMYDRAKITHLFLKGSN